MTKTGFRILFLLCLLLIVVFLIFRNRSPFGKDNSSFSTDPEIQITRIEFSGEKGKLTLEKGKESWLINSGGEARKTGIQFILRILYEIQIKSPVSEDLFETEVTGKDVKPVKVKVYSHKKLLKSFLVYKTMSNEYGNIMKMKEGSKPFIVYVPGFKGEVGSAFTVNELFWQSYNLFNLMPSEISTVEVTNNSDPSSSFSIQRNGKRFFLAGDEKNLTGWDSSLIRRYLSYFTWVPFESWVFDMNPAEKKEAESQSPKFRISVQSMSGKKSILDLWLRKISVGDSVYTDTDRLLGKTDGNSEFMIIRYFDIDPLLKKRSYFFPE